MVSQTGLGFLQVASAVAQGFVERKNKSGLIDSIVSSANHDATDEELNGIRKAMQRNYSSPDLEILRNYIMDARNSLTFSREKGAGYKIPNSSWFISTKQASTARLTDSERLMDTYTNSMALVNELVKNSNGTIDRSSALRTVYQNLGYTGQTEWREAVFGTGQEAKLDSVKMNILEDHFQYIQSREGPSGDPLDRHMVVTTDGHNALLTMDFGKGDTVDKRIRNIQDTMSYGEILKALKEDPRSPVVTEFYSRLEQAAEGASKSPEDRTKSEERAMNSVTEASNDGSREWLDDILAKVYDSSQPTDLPAIRSINNAIRFHSRGLNAKIDSIVGDTSGKDITTEDKLRLISEDILARDRSVQNELLSKPELRASYFDYIYSSLYKIYKEKRYEESLTYAIENIDLDPTEPKLLQSRIW